MCTVSQTYNEQQKRSKVTVITEIVLFSVVVVLLATTAVLTRSTSTSTAPAMVPAGIGELGAPNGTSASLQTVGPTLHHQL